VETYALDERLWNDCSGRPKFFRKDSTFSLLAFSVEAGQRLPEEEFAVHAGPEAFVVLSGEISIGTRDGVRDIPAGTVTIIDAGEDHYTLNQSGRRATLVSFGVTAS